MVIWKSFELFLPLFTCVPCQPKDFQVVSTLSNNACEDKGCLRNYIQRSGEQHFYLQSWVTYCSMFNMQERAQWKRKKHMCQFSGYIQCCSYHGHIMQKIHVHTEGSRKNSLRALPSVAWDWECYTREVALACSHSLQVLPTKRSGNETCGTLSLPSWQCTSGMVSEIVTLGERWKRRHKCKRFLSIFPTILMG